MDTLTAAVTLLVALIGAGSAITSARIAAGVRRQVTPNGGNTDRLGDRVVRIEQWMTDHDKLHDRSRP